MNDVASINLYHASRIINETFINESGEEQKGIDFFCTTLIDALPGEYVFSAIAESYSLSWNLRIHAYTDGIWQRQIILRTIPSSGDNVSISFTLNSGENGIRISARTVLNNCVLSSSQGVTALDYTARNEIADLDSRSLAYRGELTSADDLFTLQDPGVYYAAGNNHPANWPFTTNSGSYRIIVNKSTNKTNYAGASIMLFGASNVWLAIYENKAYKWHTIEIDNDSIVLKNRGVLKSSDDLHSLSASGIYHVDPAYGYPINFPYPNPGITRILVVKSTTTDNHNGEAHIVFGAKGLWYERYTYASAGWTDWMLIQPTSPLNDDLVLKAQRIGLNAVPENYGTLNAIKRARQLTDLRYKPAADFKRGFFEMGDTYFKSHGGSYIGEFSANTEYIGVPYSIKHNVGVSNSFATFVTSIANSNSAVIQESQSANADSQSASYYGVACVDLVSFALHIVGAPSAVYDQLPNITNLGYLNHSGEKMSAASLKLCDILWVTSHVALITDIVTDASDNVIAIEISDATRQGNPNKNVTNGPDGGKCRRIMMDIDSFYKWFEDFFVLRYSNLESVPYQMNPYSPMPDEGTPFVYINYPCMPYEGNMASYSYLSSRLVKVLINTTGYTHLVVLKNGSAFNEYDINGADYVNVQCDQEEAEYSAYLVIKTNNKVSSQSISCYWYIRPHMAPNLSISDGKLTVSMDMMPKQFKPFGVRFHATSTQALEEKGHTITIYDDDLTITSNQDGTVKYSFAVDYPSTNPAYVWILIVSEKYGSGSNIFRI